MTLKIIIVRGVARGTSTKVCLGTTGGVSPVPTVTIVLAYVDNAHCLVVIPFVANWTKTRILETHAAMDAILRGHTVS